MLSGFAHSANYTTQLHNCIIHDIFVQGTDHGGGFGKGGLVCLECSGFASLVLDNTEIYDVTTSTRGAVLYAYAFEGAITMEGMAVELVVEKGAETVAGKVAARAVVMVAGREAAVVEVRVVGKVSEMVVAMVAARMMIAIMLASSIEHISLIFFLKLNVSNVRRFSNKLFTFFCHSVLLSRT